MTDKQKDIQTILVTFEQFSEWDFLPTGSFFIRIASGDYLFYKSADRAKIQYQIDRDFGKGKYTAIPVKNTKTKPRTESGEYTCR